MKPWRASRHTLAQACVIGIIAVLALASLIRSLPAFFRPLEAVDFVAYYLAANLLERAEPLYISEYMQAAADRLGVVFLTVYLYPPLFAGLLRPLASLDFQTAARIWVLVNVGLMIAGTVFMVQAAKLPRWSLPLALLATFSLPAVITTLLVGQVNIVLFALISAAVYATVLASDAPDVRQQYRYDAIAGALLGLAAMVKVFPAALGIVFLFHRRWAALAGMAGATLLGLLLGLLVAGGVPNTVRWFTDVLFRIGRVNQDNLAIMQGPRNVFGRLFESHTYTYDFMAVGNSQQQTFPALIEAPALGGIVALLVSGLIFAITMLWLIWRAHQRQPLAADLVLVTAMLMLITPVLWDYYYVLWLIPLAWLARYYGQLPLYARWLVLLGCLLIILHRYWRLLAQFAASPLLLGLGFAGSVCLWAAMLILTDPRRSYRGNPDPFCRCGGASADLDCNAGTDHRYLRLSADHQLSEHAGGECGDGHGCYANRTGTGGALLKLVPGAGSAAGMTISAITASAVTTAFGEAYVAAVALLYERSHGEALSDDEIIKAFREQLEQR